MTSVRKVHATGTDTICEKVTPEAQMKSDENLLFPNQPKIEYGENTQENSFLRDYILMKAQSKGINLPAGANIVISSPKSHSDEFKTLLSKVGNGIYGARILDMMKLLAQNNQEVEKRVSKMKISDTQKLDILKLKYLFDNYYKVELLYKNQRIDLLKDDKEQEKLIHNISPEFSGFWSKERVNVRKQAVDFTKKEIQRVKLDDSGKNSSYMAMGLLPILTSLILMGVFRSRSTANAIKNNLPKFLAEQKEIFKKGVPKFTNPLKAFKGARGFALFALIGTTLTGSWDDLMGCVKDFQQDKDNFGTKTALKINIPAAFLGIASSAAIAPMIEEQISYNRAVKYLKKYGELKGSGSFIKNFMKKGGKVGLMSAGILLLSNVLKGMLTTSSSSGSSWGSMAGTRLVLEKNGNELEEKGIITKEENTFKNTTDNMMAYEAYKGKWDGIAVSDPALGIIGGGLGLYTHSNPYIQSLSFGLQGCSETITACIYQIFGANTRENKLAKEKQALVASAAN